MGLHLLVNSTACSKPKCCGSRTGPESLTQNLGTWGWEETLHVLKLPVLDGLTVPVPHPCHVVAALHPGDRSCLCPQRPFSSLCGAEMVLSYARNVPVSPLALSSAFQKGVWVGEDSGVLLNERSDQPLPSETQRGALLRQQAGRGRKAHSSNVRWVRVSW